MEWGIRFYSLGLWRQIRARLPTHTYRWYCRESFHPPRRQTNTRIDHFGKYHNTLCLSPQILQKHCFCFLLGPLLVPRVCISLINALQHDVLSPVFYAVQLTVLTNRTKRDSIPIFGYNYTFRFDRLMSIVLSVYKRTFVFSRIVYVNKYAIIVNTLPHTIEEYIVF